MEIVTWKNSDLDLRDGNGLIAYWSRSLQCIRTGRTEFAHLNKQPATEAHGLLILNAIKQQLENDNE